MSTGEYPHVINVFLVLAQSRVEIKCGSIRHIATRLVRNNGNVVAYLALVRIAFERIKRIAHRDVRRPGEARISAPRIKQLRISVIRGVACVIPDRVKAAIGGYRKCAEPVPLAGINRVVVNLLRRAEG